MRLLPIRATVVSRTPGRLRFRVDPPSRRVETLRQIEEQIARQPGVDQVEMNPWSGSVVVRYQPAIDGDAILSTLRAAGLDLTTPPPAIPAGQTAGLSTASLSVIDVFRHVDQTIFRATERIVNLKFLFPFVLFAVGIRQTMTKGLGINQVPGYVLLWYALDAFIKFHQEDTVVARRSSDRSVLADEPDPDPAGPESGSDSPAGDSG